MNGGTGDNQDTTLFLCIQEEVTVTTKQQTLSAPFFTLIVHFNFQATATITVNTW